MRLGPLTFAIAAAFLPAPAPAQEYPSRPVLFVVPYAPGGGTETMARLLLRPTETCNFISFSCHFFFCCCCEPCCSAMRFYFLSSMC